MLTAMTLIFLAGYLAIALEHPLKMNKAGTALLTGTILWVIYTFAAPECIPTVSADAFKLSYNQTGIGRTVIYPTMQSFCS